MLDNPNKELLNRANDYTNDYIYFQIVNPFLSKVRKRRERRVTQMVIRYMRSDGYLRNATKNEY